MTILPVLLALIGTASSSQAGVIYTSPLTTWTGSESTLSPRLFRDGAPSAYPVLKVYPGTFAETDSYVTFNVVSSALAYEWLITPLVEDTRSFFSIYAGSFDPLNLNTNYLGDQGSSDVTAAFSVPVAPSSTYVIVASGVGGVSASSGHSFQFEVAEVPEPGAMALIAAGLLGVGLLRRSRR